VGDLWTAYWLSFGVVFIAELGEKSQLIRSHSPRATGRLW
jgi:hypothetical protein